MARRKDNLDYYDRVAMKFMKDLKCDIVNFKSLCEKRDIVLNEHIKLFLWYIDEKVYVRRGDCLIHLYMMKDSCKKRWGKVSLSDAVNFTYYCFTQYGKQLDYLKVKRINNE